MDIGIPVLHQLEREIQSSGKKALLFCPILGFVASQRAVTCRHIDGHDYMWAISEMLDQAKEAIFILVQLLVLYHARYLQSTYLVSP